MFFGSGLGVGWDVGIGVRLVSILGLVVIGVGIYFGVGIGLVVGLIGYFGIW